MLNTITITDHHTPATQFVRGCSSSLLRTLHWLPPAIVVKCAIMTHFREQKLCLRHSGVSCTSFSSVGLESMEWVLLVEILMFDHLFVIIENYNDTSCPGLLSDNLMMVVLPLSPDHNMPQH